MSDIFISYGHSTVKQAQQVFDALRELGYGVWLDDQLPAHRAYTDVIEERLKAAKAIVVIWSAEAAKSHWVRAEANTALEAGKLVQLTVDGVMPPMPFNQIQCANLSGWTGDVESAGWRKVVDSIADLIGGSLAPPQSVVAATVADTPLPLPTKPSIAILPFANLSGDPEQDYFADGMVEEVATALSRFPSLFVNAGGSNVTDREGARNLKQIAQELGVRYLLEGSVRKSGDRVRIAVKLVDPEAGEQLWAERFDGVVEDVFALQDRVANAVASQIKPNIEAAEIRRAHAKPTQDLTAYDLWLRALRVSRGVSREASLEAVRLADQAVTLDPDYAMALALAGWIRSMLVAMAWSVDAEADRREGLAQAQRALSIAPDDAQVLAYVGGAMASFGAELSAADALLTRARERNPGLSMAWYSSGWVSVYIGRDAVALDYFETALRLDLRSPDRPNILNGMAWSLLGLRRFEEAYSLYQQVIPLLPGHTGPRIGLAATLAHLGRIEEAKAILENVPAATIAALTGGAVYRNPVGVEILRSGLALAAVDV
jgi:TolB-like protein/Tfp pilus assembly protein PilF